MLDTMHNIARYIRRLQNLLIAMILVCLFLYWFLIPRDDGDHAPAYITDGRERHPVSYFLASVKTNETLFNMAIDHKFHDLSSKAAIQHYLRPDQFPHTENAVVSVKNQLFDFDRDVIVFLHIQKAGGTTFNYHLINDLAVEKLCNCGDDVMTNPCHCKTERGNIWLFSWFTVGWPCELHADWTMLHECVDRALDQIEGHKRNRIYHYITLFRDPIARYLSEWKHQRDGSHWKDGKLRCAGERVSLFDVRPCFREQTWRGVSFSEFMDCVDNLATNRQTRMVADLTKSHCYSRKKLKPVGRSRLQLESAFENIDQMTFFGLTEHQKISQYLFEKTLGLKFVKDFKEEEDNEYEELITEEEFVRMMEFIELDVQLYLRAKYIFNKRLERIS